MTADVEHTLKQIKGLDKASPDYDDLLREILEEFTRGAHSTKIRLFRKRRQEFFDTNAEQIKIFAELKYSDRPWRRPVVKELIEKARACIGYADTCAGSDIWLMISRHYKETHKL